MRVAELRYELRVHDERIHFLEDARLDITLGNFQCSLESGSLISKPVSNYDNEDDARGDLEPYLRGWAAKADLLDGVQMSFRFSGSQLMENNGGTSARVLAETVQATSTISALVSKSAYPAPDARWHDESSLALDLRTRLRDLLSGGPLSAIAYRMLTSIQDAYGGKADVRSRLSVSGGVLDEIHRLAGEDRERKVTKRTRPLSDDERAWVRRAMQALTIRVHEVEAGIASLPTLNKSDI